ncbi:MAG: carboxypeptidase regulatory-like domain-containing protein [Bacteroidetes bacterium]|nr:carboxypeptidase regulatory-like domain-containing protein [Bacteroidota bacterium]
MKKTLFVLILAAVFCGPSFSQSPQSYVILNPNNISTHIVSSGIFNQDITSANAPGFQWPGGSQRFAIFTSGFCIAAKVNGALLLASASYRGEYCPGFTVNGVPATNSDFKIYKVSFGDGPSNPDWVNWYKMVPYGAPYVDVNHNGVYDNNIDTPGVKNAQQTIFVCMTDGFASTHTQAEGFSGGTAPLFSEMHMTSWGYQRTGFNDVQYIRWEIINKGTNRWDSTYMGIFSDPDLGDAVDDFIGCDTIRQMGYCYNADNMDGTGNPPSYGANPPAVGMILLKSCVENNVTPPNRLRLKSFTQLLCGGCGPSCEWTPSTPPEAYLFLKGRKKSGTYFMNPTTTPPSRTKFCYSGDPETNEGWTEFRGSILNCTGDTGTVVAVNTGGDRKFLLGFGSDNLSINSGDTQRIAMAQLIARGTNNLNSVTRLKTLADFVTSYYNSTFEFHTITGTVRYLDNNQPVTSGIVKAVKLDRSTGSVLVLDSAYVSNGTYMLGHVPQDSVDIGLYPVTTPPRDFLISYYPSTIYWQDAVTLYPEENLTNVNLNAIRIEETTSGNSVNGKITGLGEMFAGPLKDANVYAKNGNTFVRCATSDANGLYHITSLPSGTLKIIVDRMGYRPDSTNVTITSTGNIDSVNFYLNRIYVGVKQTETQIPLGFNLEQNFPNPFNPVTNIKFGIPANGFVKLTVYNILGQETATLINETMSAGSYEVSWNASAYPSGVYFYRMQFRSVSGITGDFIQTRKMALIK